MDGWRREDGWMEGRRGKDGMCGVHACIVCGQGASLRVGGASFEGRGCHLRAWVGSFGGGGHRLEAGGVVWGRGHRLEARGIVLGWWVSFMVVGIV